MELLIETMKQDWWVLLPIVICSIFTVMVAIDRAAYYNANKRNVVEFIPRLQKELSKNNLMGAQNLAIQCGGIIGEVTEEGRRDAAAPRARQAAPLQGASARRFPRRTVKYKPYNLRVCALFFLF